MRNKDFQKSDNLCFVAQTQQASIFHILHNYSLKISISKVFR
jgi:hypothetical protein